ncbi:hypothetical protein ABT282_07050 [Streptomyces sp. NPDC000927]|uniref:hypothetical protein n=1 Tax=Streptomyces sp. NPDC000927 TaxID=3154371 RepID=UPI00332AFE36
MTEGKVLYLIGERYNTGAATRKGVAVIRPAVLESALGPTPRIITTSPCCPTETRRLDFDNVTSDLAKKSDGWLEKCRHCNWHYRVLPEHTGDDARLGLYGVRWISKGF